MPAVLVKSAKVEAFAVLLDYRPAAPLNRLNDVRAALVERGVSSLDADILTYDRFAPDDFETRLRARLEAHRCRRVLIDISTMSKLAIMLVLAVCGDLNVDVRLFYAEAQSYGPTQAEFEHARENRTIQRPSLGIYTGVHGVVRVNSLASVAMQGQPTAAVVFIPFNNALTQVLLNTILSSATISD